MLWWSNLFPKALPNMDTIADMEQEKKNIELCELPVQAGLFLLLLLFFIPD